MIIDASLIGNLYWHLNTQKYDKINKNNSLCRHRCNTACWVMN